MLTDQQAYAAMFAFLEHWYGMTKSNDVAALLGSLSLLPNGSPADPALASDWSDAVQRAVEGRVNVTMQLTRS